MSVGSTRKDNDDAGEVTVMKFETQARMQASDSGLMLSMAPERIDDLLHGMYCAPEIGGRPFEVVEDVR